MKIIENNLANILTVTRLLLLPLIVALFFVESSWGGLATWPCLILFILAAATDYFDGYVARKLNQITAFGTFLDPISDKIFVATLLVMLVATERIEGLWIICVLLIFAREFLVSGMREYLGPHDVQMPVTDLAKWKTAAQMLSLGFLIIGKASPVTHTLGLLFLAAATGLTLITGLHYTVVGIAHMRKNAQDESL